MSISQTWSELLGTTSDDYAQSISISIDGSIYVTGNTGGNLDGKTKTGSTDAFIAKYNSDGSKAWSKLLGASSYAYANSITTGAERSIYIAGNTGGNLDGKTNKGSTDAFIAKYNSDGTKIWTQVLGSDSVDYAESISTTANGLIYIAGFTEGNLDAKINRGSKDAFIAKFNSDGSKVWTQMLGSNQSDAARCVATSADGSIYIAGVTYGDLDGITNKGNGDAFIAKYNSDGVKAWIKLLGSERNDEANSVCSALDGSIYIAGYTSGNLDGKTKSGGYCAFIAKYNSNGTKAWTELLGSNIGVSASSIATSADGTIYLTGYTNGNLDGAVNRGESDAFIAKFTSDGVKMWTQVLGSESFDEANSISTALDGSIYIAGATYGNLGGKINSGSYDAFIAKIDSANSLPTLTPTPSTSKTYSFFSLADATAEEGKIAQVTISRSGDTTQTQVVSLSTSNNTATAGADYTAFSGNITFTPGQTSNTVSLSTLDDTAYEGNEFFNLIGGTISSGTNNVSAWSTPTAKITILDNDAAPPSTLDASSFTALSLTPEALPTYSAGNAQMDKYYYYVERYPLTLRTAFVADYIAGRATNEAIWGQNHWLNYGNTIDGRVLEVVTGTEDTKDYGAYVENYGTTLLDIYRKDPRAPINGGIMSMFAWGKEHFNNWGKAEGRQIDGGVDWGAIVRNNLDLYNKWQDARRVSPTLSAFAYGYNNQSSISQNLSAKIGSDNQDKLTGGIVYGLNANDVIVGTAGNDILAGGFGDDLIVGVNGGSDTVFGGPGRDVFQLNAGTTLNIRDFRKGADLIQLGGALASTGVTMQWDSADNSTYFYQGTSILGKVFGRSPTEFSYADSSSGISKVYI